MKNYNKRYWENLLVMRREEQRSRYNVQMILAQDKVQEHMMDIVLAVHDELKSKRIRYHPILRNYAERDILYVGRTYG